MPIDDATSTAPIAVTGVTGRLGGAVARRLAALEVPLRLLARDLSRVPQLPGARVAPAEFGDAAGVRAALEGVRTVLMVSAGETLDRVDRHRTFVDDAAAAGVDHLVYVSYFGAAPRATFTLARDHWATEEHIRASGLAHTFLRDNLYLDFLPEMAGEDGVIRGPAGSGRAAAVAIDDVADAAVAVLRSPEQHRGATYDLTGPEALTFTEMADLLARGTGRPVSFVDETVEEAYASRVKYGAPGWQVEAWVSTYAAVARGELDGVTDAVPRLTGHPATSLAELLRRPR
jgi:NAD(P)H dehydrogenase (quinone)